MIELLIKACLLAAPLADADRECRDFSLLFDAREVSVMTCMVQAQPIIAQWQQTHQNWDVQGWTCGMLSRTISSI